MRYFSTFPNRTVCGALDDMRKLNETRNYSGLLGLIEEVQIMANRMETGLYDKNDIEAGHKEKNKLKKEIKKLENEIEKLEEKKEKLSV